MRIDNDSASQPPSLSQQTDMHVILENCIHSIQLCSKPYPSTFLKLSHSMNMKSNILRLMLNIMTADIKENKLSNVVRKCRHQTYLNKFLPKRRPIHFVSAVRSGPVISSANVRGCFEPSRGHPNGRDSVGRASESPRQASWI